MTRPHPAEPNAPPSGAAAAPAGPLSRPAVEAIVAEVMRRLAGPASPAATSKPPAAPARAADGLSGSESGAPNRSPSDPAIPDPEIPDRVVTLAAIERLPAGTRAVRIEPQAVVTPSAVEAARDRGIRLARGRAAGPAVARPPVLVVVAEPTPAAMHFAAACAAAVSPAETLSVATLAEAVARLASAASGGAARGVLVTSRPAAAVILANRSASLRAVTARDLSTARAGIAETAANLVVCDPVTLPRHLAGRLAALVAVSDSPPPDELAAAPAGCGCKSHSH